MKKAVTAEHLAGWSIPDDMGIDVQSALTEAGELTVPSILKSDHSPKAKLWLLCHEDLVAPKRLVNFYTKIAADKMREVEDNGTELDKLIVDAIGAAQHYIMGRLHHETLQDIRRAAYASCALLTNTDFVVYNAACIAARCAVIPRIDATARRIVAMAAETEEDYERYLQLMVKMLKRKKKRK
jgi:hypothetical protein